MANLYVSDDELALFYEMRKAVGNLAVTMNLKSEVEAIALAKKLFIEKRESESPDGEEDARLIALRTAVSDLASTMNLKSEVEAIASAKRLYLENEQREQKLAEQSSANLERLSKKIDASLARERAVKAKLTRERSLTYEGGLSFEGLTTAQADSSLERLNGSLGAETEPPAGLTDDQRKICESTGCDPETFISLKARLGR